MDDEEIDEPAVEPDEDDEPDVAPVAPATPDASFDELLSKQIDAEEDDEEDTILSLTREERLESLSIKATPIQANEFVCKNCHLVKHNGQLADAKRGLCRDCV